MTPYVHQAIRCAVDVSRAAGIVNVEGESPFVWRSNDARFELAFFMADQLLDISLWNSLTIRIKPRSNITGDPVASKTVTEFNADLTLEDWQSGAGQHVSVIFSQAETGLSVGDYYWVVSVITQDVPAKDVTLGTGLLSCIEDGRNGTAAPPVDPDLYYDRVTADARFAQKKPTIPNYIPGTDNMFRPIYFNATTNQIELGDPIP